MPHHAGCLHLSCDVKGVSFWIEMLCVAASVYLRVGDAFVLLEACAVGRCSWRRELLF